MFHFISLFESCCFFVFVQKPSFLFLPCCHMTVSVSLSSKYNSIFRHSTKEKRFERKDNHIVHYLLIKRQFICFYFSISYYYVVLFDHFFYIIFSFSPNLNCKYSFGYTNERRQATKIFVFFSFKIPKKRNNIEIQKFVLCWFAMVSLTLKISCPCIIRFSSLSSWGSEILRKIKQSIWLQLSFWLLFNLDMVLWKILDILCSFEGNDSEIENVKHHKYPKFQHEFS